MTRTGIGQDGLLRIGKESVYGTPVTPTVYLPITPETKITAEIADIENNNQIGSRLKQEPNAGRATVTGSIALDQVPDLMGTMFSWFLGASANAGSAGVGYTHTWLSPVSGESAGLIYTVQQYIGADLGDEFASVTIKSMTLKSDNSGNQAMTIDVVGYKHSDDDVARPASVTISSKIPYYFGQTAITITPISGSPITQLCDSYELKLDLGLDTERFKIGSQFAEQPKFNTIPSCSLTVAIDGEKRFFDWATAKQYFSITVVTTGTDIAGGTTPYSWAVEIPKAKLATSTNRDNGNDTIKMNLEFDCGFGGVTTGSAVVERMFEVRVVDATASY